MPQRKNKIFAPGRHGLLPAGAFIERFNAIGAEKLAEELGVHRGGVYARRRRIEASLKRAVPGPNPAHPHLRQEQVRGRIDLAIQSGVVLVAGDAHYWPGPRSLMHRGLIHFLKRFREGRLLRAIIMNGDVTDFACISRWPQVDWEQQPTVKDEIEVCTERMHEIAVAAGKVPKLWPLGNHDARWSIMLASNVPKFAEIHGMHLKDHFPLWEACWSVDINGGTPGHTTVKHSYKNGEHATSNNVKNAGVHCITNHLHSAQVRPFTNSVATLYGVDTGCLADVWGPQFLYLQNNPRNWRSAFAVLTYSDGFLMPPELVFAWGKDHVTFRGEIIKP